MGRWEREEGRDRTRMKKLLLYCQPILILMNEKRKKRDPQSPHDDVTESKLRRLPAVKRLTCLLEPQSRSEQWVSSKNKQKKKEKELWKARIKA